MNKNTTYTQAIKQSIAQEMSIDNSVIVMGIGVEDHKGIYGTTLGLKEKFGTERVIDTPLAEDGMTGIAIGAALAGMKPIHIHIRMDFVLLAMNQLINVAAKSSYMFGGNVSVPIVVRCFIGRSWGQGPQHSQALHSFFMHVPGLKVVMPSTPYDAKGLLTESIRDSNPVIFIEHRLLANTTSDVPEKNFSIPFGKCRVLKKGNDLTIVAVSHMVLESLRACEHLNKTGINVELIDPRTLNPLDSVTIINSVKKTKNLLIVDNGWLTAGFSAEIIAKVIESVGNNSINIQRMGFQQVTCPTTPSLEEYFYPNTRTIFEAAFKMIKKENPKIDLINQISPNIESLEFKGPF